MPGRVLLGTHTLVSDLHTSATSLQPGLLHTFLPAIRTHQLPRWWRLSFKHHRQSSLSRGGAGQGTLMSGLLTAGTRLTTIRNGNRRGSWCPLSPPRGCFSAPGDLMWAPYSAPPSLTTRLCIYRIFYPGSSKSSVTRWQVQLSLFYGRRSPVQGGKGDGSRLLEPARAPGTVCGSPAETDSPRHVLVGDCALVIAVPPRLLQCPAPHECPIHVHQVPA